MRLLVFTALWLAPAIAGAQIEVEIEAPDVIGQGQRAQILARVRGAGEHPVLVTPRSEGTAIEVVRGRLLRAEARDPEAEVLEFRLPIIARGAGTSVLRVEVRGYACEARCRAVRAEASAVLTVRGAAHRKSKQARGPRTSSLSWVRLPGAEGCIGSAELARRVHERLGRHVFVSAADGSLAVEGRVEPGDEGWRAFLQIADAGGESLGERELTSDEESCDQLGDLVAVTIALMIDPLTAPEPEPAEEAPDDEPEERVVVVTERVEVEVPAEPEEPPGPRWRIEIDASGAGSLGLSPTAALGGIGAVILEIPDFVPIVVEGALFPFSRAVEDGVGQADFFHVHAGFQICPLALRESGIALHGCLGADAGAVLVIGGDEVDNPERVIGQAHAAVRGHFDIIGPLTLRAGLHLLVPFRHDPYIATSSGGQLYAPEPIAGMLDLGVGAHFDF